VFVKEEEKTLADFRLEVMRSLLKTNYGREEQVPSVLEGKPASMPPVSTQYGRIGHFLMKHEKQ